MMILTVVIDLQIFIMQGGKELVKQSKRTYHYTLNDIKKQIESQSCKSAKSLNIYLQRAQRELNIRDQFEEINKQAEFNLKSNDLSEDRFDKGELNEKVSKIDERINEQIINTQYTIKEFREKLESLEEKAQKQEQFYKLRFEERQNRINLLKKEMQAKLVSNVHLQQNTFAHHLQTEFDQKIIDIFANDYLQKEAKSHKKEVNQLINDQKCLLLQNQKRFDQNIEKIEISTEDKLKLFQKNLKSIEHKSHDILQCIKNQIALIMHEIKEDLRQEKLAREQNKQKLLSFYQDFNQKHQFDHRN